jgi:AcrR family transcriptional regulator
MCFLTMNDVSDRDNPSQKPPKRKSGDKADTILAGAMQEFMTYGFAAASMDRISAAAGVSKPTLYSYFQDKEGLFTALIEQMTQGEDNLKFWEDSFLKLPLRESLKQMAMKMLTNVSGKQPLFTFVRLIIGESGRFPGLAKVFVRYIEKPNIERVSRLLASHPEFKGTDPEVTARCFMGSILHYVIVQEILHGREILPMEKDRYVEGLIEMIAK